MRQGGRGWNGMRVLALLVALLTLLALGAGAGAASAAKGGQKEKPPPALSGRIQSGPWYDALGTPAWQKLRVPVQLVDLTGAVRGSVTPDEWGEFRFSHVAPGTYRVRFTYPSYYDVTPTRTWTSPPLTWAARTAWEVLVDIDPYTNNPSYQQLTDRTRCPAAVPAGVGCNR